MFSCSSQKISQKYEVDKVKYQSVKNIVIGNISELNSDDASKIIKTKLESDLLNSETLKKEFTPTTITELQNKITLCADFFCKLKLLKENEYSHLITISIDFDEKNYIVTVNHNFKGNVEERKFTYPKSEINIPAKEDKKEKEKEKITETKTDEIVEKPTELNINTSKIYSDIQSVINENIAKGLSEKNYIEKPVEIENKIIEVPVEIPVWIYREQEVIQNDDDTTTYLVVGFQSFLGDEMMTMSAVKDNAIVNISNLKKHKVDLILNKSIKDNQTYYSSYSRTNNSGMGTTHKQHRDEEGNYYILFSITE